jgi:hypothetical protein
MEKAMTVALNHAYAGFSLFQVLFKLKIQDKLLPSERSAYVKRWMLK